MFIRYCMAKVAEHMETERFRNYAAEALYTILENQSRNGGKYLSRHYYELTEPPKPEKTPEDIIADLKKNGALEVV